MSSQTATDIATGGLSALGRGIGSKKSAPKDAANIQAASQQQAIDEQRRQFDATRASLMPFITQGQDFMGQVGQGATLGGFSSSLNDILNSPAFAGLRDQRTQAINSSFGHGGMLNSGGRASAIGNDLTNFGLGIENMLYGRQQGIENNGLNAASGLGAFGQNSANSIGTLMQGQGEAQANGLLGSQQAKTQFINQLLTGAGALFSDRRLKENIRPVSEIGPLTVYDWDWIPEIGRAHV